jgi:hypothetical protein
MLERCLTMAKTQLPVLVTPTRVELGLRCYRRHAISDILQRASYSSPSLEFGSVVHAGAGVWWAANKQKFSPADARGYAMAGLGQEYNKRFTMNPEINVGDHTLELAQRMLENYLLTARIAGPLTDAADDWDITMVEERLEVPLLRNADGVLGLLSFQPDRMVSSKSLGVIAAVDTKTASRFDKRWMRRWEMSLQMKLYKAGLAKAYDWDPSKTEIIIEGVLKDVPSEVRYVACPDWSKDVLSEAVNQAHFIASRDYSLITSEDQPRNLVNIIQDAVTKTSVNYEDCYAYGVECPFRKLCVAEPEQRVALLMAEYFEINEADSGY